MSYVSSLLVDNIDTIKIVLLYGPLGAGKTRIVQHFLDRLGYAGLVTSPTFSLVNEYAIKQRVIYHFDLYRLDDTSELYEIGFDEILSRPGTISFVEWPRLIEQDVLDGAWLIHITYTPDPSKRAVEIFRPKK